MDSAVYVALARQSGLMRELQGVANNIANAGTTGFRREAVIFAEHVSAAGSGAPSLSIAHAHGRGIDLTQGALTQTDAAYDFAIEGEGFFQVETSEGPALTRAGRFTPNAAGELATAEGHRLLDEAGGPVFVPAGQRPHLAPDGTLSVEGRPIGRIGLWQPAQPGDLRHRAGTLFSAEGAIQPQEGATILQGFLESSNVDPIIETARMIEVGRAYELGQSLLDGEDRRIRDTISTMME
ncbi:flagellar hook-basal body complex protein [Frigidibacter oleivorans]|uniref:flagellar hook-basal body complex protein n=1 Tax=Frigidibacter oleivorans TaxID=2487129 RepID=UPI000F8C3E0B|nr:flagellar hook-basal body complex protein [Frigidibacter oleivorans]